MSQIVSPSNSPNYDANLIVILDRDMTGNQKVIFQSENILAEDSNPNNSLLRPLTVRNRIRKMIELDAPEVIVEPDQNILKELTANLNKKYGKRVVETILDGKLNLAFLINSDGGMKMMIDIYSELVKEVLSRQGHNSVYVTDRAYSAAAMLFELGQERYSLSNSQILWHLSTLASGLADKQFAKITRARQVEMAAEEMNDIRDFFRRSVTDPLLKVIALAAINQCERDPNNKDNAVCFSGRALFGMEIINRVFKTRTDLKKHFLIGREKLDESKLVKNFFAE